MGFFGFILFGVCSASWIWTLCLSPNLESFHLLFLQKVSLFYFLSPCPFETLMIWMLDALLLSYRSLSLCLSFVNIFFSVVKISWIVLFCLSSSSLILSSVISALLLSPSNKFFYLLFYFLVLQFPLGTFIAFVL